MKNSTYNTCASVVIALFAFAPFAYAVTYTDADGNTVEYGADGSIQVKTVDGTAAAQLDSSGNVLKATDADGNSFERDASTGAFKASNSSGAVQVGSDGKVNVTGTNGEKVQLDKNGNLIKAEDGEGNSVEADGNTLHVKSGDVEVDLENSSFQIDLSDFGNMKEDVEMNNGTNLDIHDAREVHTSQDFKTYVANAAKVDVNLKGVEVKNGAVSLDYQEPAAWFGFIDSSLNAHVSADASGNVEVSYPWYHIFMKKHVAKDTIKSEVAAAVSARKSGITNVSGANGSVSTSGGVQTVTDANGNTVRLDGNSGTITGTKDGKTAVVGGSVNASAQGALSVPYLFEIIHLTLKNSSVSVE